MIKSVMGSFMMAVLCAGVSLAEDVVLESFSRTGELSFTQVSNAVNYRVEWASSPAGPWQTFSAAAAVLDDLAPVPGAMASASVPMVYRVVAVVAGPAEGLVINEVDYDQPGGDTMEFVELYNGSAQAIDLSGYSLELINGSNAEVYGTIDLSVLPAPLAAGEYLVLGASNLLDTITADLELAIDVAMQNGPDAVRLLASGNVVVDQLVYEGEISGYGEGDFSPGDLADADSLQRIPNGSDTNDNASDFSLLTPTPGVQNQ